MSPNISLASTLSGGHVGHRGAWENVRQAKGKAVSTADASEGKKGESLPADGPAVSAIANLQAIDGIPLFSVYWGPVETQGGHARFQHGTGDGHGRQHSSGTRVRHSPGDPRWGTQVGHSPGVPVAQPEHQHGQPLSSDSPEPVQTAHPAPFLPLLWEQTHHVSWYPGYHIRDIKLRRISASPTVSGANQTRPADPQSTKCWEPRCHVFQKP